MSEQVPTVEKRHTVTTREAAFIGVASMVGAGIFSLLGTAGEVAGSAVWVSFVLAGIVAAFQGYSFARLGSRYPSGGGMLEYVNQAFGRGHVSTVVAWLGYMTNAIVTAMVAVSFGSYASSAVANGDPVWGKLFAVAIVIAMTALNIAGSTIVARVQSLIVFIVVGILGLFAVVTLTHINPDLLAPSTYPAPRLILSSVALTFFAFLGFGVVTFTAKDLADPSRQLPRAMTIAIGLAAVVYVAVSLGVFGTLTVPEVIAAGPTAIAIAAQPVLGNLGFWLMTITALFATSGATNAGLYPAPGLSDHLVGTGQFPTVMARRLGDRASVGLLVVAVVVVIQIVAFNLSAIASLGSAVALLVFTVISIGHLRIIRETHANAVLIWLAVITSAVALVTFCLTSLLDEPASLVALAVIIGLSIVLDVWWARAKARLPAAA